MIHFLFPQEHPWNSLDENLDVGSVVKGKIVNVADYGAFLELTPGVEGLIHVSEMSWSQHLRNPSDFMKNGDDMEAVVLSIDRNEKKMSLGVKQLTKDPWSDNKLLKKYSIGTVHSGKVRNLTNFGLFLKFKTFLDPKYPIEDLRPPINLKIILSTGPLYFTKPSTPSGTYLDLSFCFV